MALKATIYKAELQVSDLDRHHYETYALTVAKHPSETAERMMIRLMAFALYADEGLAFTRGLSTDSEPELWKMSPQGDIDLWVELGQPDEKRIRKACAKAGEVVIVGYGEHKTEPWWQKNREALSRCNNLTVIHLPMPQETDFEAMVRRTMPLQATIDDGTLWFTAGEATLHVQPTVLKPPA
ncbi:YaeQ family protein [Desulfoluna butyratoxydans]|uniref:Yaeq n=1 Tax=Desulfoluna butyratoxydans TaxID=231438 RepID=A0A4U8YXQ4_9BACT|nr:YaeQ family protein [Desulfoluna butyratoxydans]VFQ46852.1 yaeq [Desulfoluna butyratoxydans]